MRGRISFFVCGVSRYPRAMLVCISKSSRTRSGIRTSLAAAAATVLVVVTPSTYADGIVGCWGNNDFGQLNVPSSVGVAKQVGAGFAHTLAVTSTNNVVCWGSNQFGQSTVPASLGTVLFAAAGHQHNIAIKTAGTVQCWGLNADGQCNVPGTLGTCTWVAAGGGHSMAVRTSGAVACWGFNGDGQCNVPGTLGACSRVAAGSDHSIAIRTTGAVVCWGRNAAGQCNVPATLGTCTQIAGGFDHTVALRTNGTVVCWGLNSDGQCSVPASLGSCVAIAAGYYHTLAIRSNGTVAAWGLNDFGQGAVPASVPPSNRIAAGGEHSVVVVSSPIIQLVQATQPTCGLSNGAIDVTITNGVTVQWTGPNGFTATTADLTNLAPGTYNIVVTGVAGTVPAGGQVQIPAIADTVAPTVTSFTATIAAQANQNCQAPVANFAATVVATDNCSVTAITQVPAAGTLVGLGNTAVTISVRDAANNVTTRAATFTVTGTSSTWYRDQDGDGVGNAASGTLQACTQPPGYVATAGDECPQDPAKLLPGVCGCGVADTDANANGTPDCLEVCDGDINDDGSVEAADLALLLSVWGAPGGGKLPAADIDGDGEVGAADLSLLLANWGACGR